jgi:hypothetical protein
MSSLSNINNNSSVINVGRTTPVNPGPQPAAGSIPVVVATDQTPIPVVEQNKIQSEVALSLLGIPRSEVALGIFADVNTYDVNPVEWASEPLEYVREYGIKHLPEEAGALVEAPKNKTAILTSKRFFRYQPGRVSSATFGVKSTVTPTENVEGGEYNLNPAIRKYGIFDKYDGYYWENIADGKDDRFSVVRRTQSLLKYIPVEFGTGAGQQQQDYGFAGKTASSVEITSTLESTAVKLLMDNRFVLANDAFDAAVAVGGAVGTYLNGLSATDKIKCLRDMDFAIDAYFLDLQWGGNAHTIINATTYATAILNNAAAESTIHEKLRDQIISILNDNDETTASAKINTISQFTINAVQGIQPTQGQIDSANYAQRSKLSSVFSIYNRYLGYLVSESMTYQNNNPELTVAEIKYRCLRDVVYIVDGYAKDLEFGGNAATVYNAKNYYFNGIQVFSQTNGGVVAEVARHTYLRDLISSTSNVNVVRSNSTTVAIPSVFTRFGLSSNTTKLNQLANLIIANFTTPYSGPAEFGTAAQFGNLVILRDNLIMIHAAVFDPSLLKKTKQVVVKVDVTANTLEAAEGSFVVGQYINFIGNAGGLVNSKTYVVLNVAGPKGNIIKLGNPLSANPSSVVDITTVGTGVQYIEPTVPFVLPTEYWVGNTPEDPAGNFIKPDGLFPYLYTQDGISPAVVSSKTVGFIDTAIDPSSNAGTLKQQIDAVNLRWNNWIKQNVDPAYYSVYEYRVPRSRFSTDHLNGETNSIVYSDVATGETGKVYAGQPVRNDGVQIENNSVWNLDFTKVAMLKIEFSWYGAVGALFLAYVPVSNGEARWVRVHHLRASNQLKISSLGNATLPITYLVYGGGDPLRLGILDQTDKGYGSSSDHIVKYGASYYIDGGDRGTVRLYSHSNNDPVNVYGGRYNIGNVTLESDSIGSYIDLSAVPELPNDKTFFMNARLTTSSRQDQNVEVEWIDGNKIYLNRPALASENGINLIVDRPSIVFGLKAKENILNQVGEGVRNRVQVYPTKLATANLSSKPIKLKILKTPLFQSAVSTQGDFLLTEPYEITSLNLALPTTSNLYLENNGDFVYGWFRANVGTVLGKLYKDADAYFFTLLGSFSVPVILFSNIKFLKEARFDFEGNVLASESEFSSTKERLSSVFISTQIQMPIPKTGTEVCSFFLTPGSDQFDLLSYFDYNKDYLSFPLTNQIESLYLSCDSSESRVTEPVANILASLTWEEQ